MSDYQKYLKYKQKYKQLLAGSDSLKSSNDPSTSDIFNHFPEGKIDPKHIYNQNSNKNMVHVNQLKEELEKDLNNNLLLPKPLKGYKVCNNLFMKNNINPPVEVPRGKWKDKYQPSCEYDKCTLWDKNLWALYYAAQLYAPIGYDEPNSRGLTDYLIARSELLERLSPTPLGSPESNTFLDNGEYILESNQFNDIYNFLYKNVSIITFEEAGY